MKTDYYTSKGARKFPVQKSGDTMRYRLIRYAAVLICLFMASVIGAKAADNDGKDFIWSVQPSYETPQGRSKDIGFGIVDSYNNLHNIYSSSYAVIIEEGAYKYQSAWTPVIEESKKYGDQIKEILEKQGYRVFVWRDLTGTQLRNLLEDIINNLGYEQEARLFFYYFGHGYVYKSTAARPGDASEQGGDERGFLVSVDAPDPAKDRAQFLSKALPITRLIEISNEMTLRHAFFALESCKAGSIFRTRLENNQVDYPTGYVLSQNVQRPARQFVTAGDANESVPAGVFSDVLYQGIKSADADIGFVTGSSLIDYVKRHVPDAAPANRTHPESQTLPSEATAGDMIISQSEKFKPTAVKATEKRLAKENIDTIISASVPGDIVLVAVKVGDVVQKGQILFSTDARPFEITLKDADSDRLQAQVNLSNEQSKLRSLMERAPSGQIAKSDLDAQYGAVRVAEALVEKAQAKQLQIKFELAQTTRRAPTCSRVTGLLQNLGSRVEVGTPVVSLAPGC